MVDFSIRCPVRIILVFVEKNDPIDLEARKRGNSFYFPDRVIPMLPEKLSNDICSLIPRKIRACVICEIQIKGNKIDKYQFHRGKIRSVARLTYQEVDEIQSNKKSKYFFIDLIALSDNIKPCINITYNNIST